LEQGIGKATAILYAKEKCRSIVVADINHDTLILVQKEIESTYDGVRVAAIQVDVRDETSVKQLISGAVAAFGRIDYCANVAGIIRFGDSSILPVDDWDLVQQINLRGTFLCAKYQIKAMLEQEPLTSKYVFQFDRIVLI